MIERIVKQEYEHFVLTIDMVPIDVDMNESFGCIFTCPLPKGYREIVKNNLEEIDVISKDFVTIINKEAALKHPPFQNILLGYHERSEKEQKELLKGFKIMQVYTDNRGVYGVWAGGNVNSGDIHLDSSAGSYCGRIIAAAPFHQFFEPKVAFCCHNIDYYWQALLTREFCLKYFNWLNKKIFEGKR